MRKLVLLLVSGGLMALLASIMVMVVTDTSPTQAEGHKITICHFDNGKFNPNDKEIRAPSWSIITIKSGGSAEDAHLGGNGHEAHHNNNIDDKEIDNGATAAQCLSGAGSWNTDRHFPH